jgi:2-aminobenzoate-CoA ligase
MMPLARTGYADTFARDNLPPAAHWPLLEFTSDLLKYPERLNAAAEIIDVPTAVYGADRPALKTQDGAVWTYGELRARANQIARVLTEDLGLVTGNRVLLRAPNNPWTVAAWLGVIKAGGIVVTTMAALRARELAPIVAKTRPSIALVDHRHADDVRLVADSTAPGLRIVAYGGDAADDLTRLIRGKAGDFAAADTAADDVALFGPTSGSTGVPKITTHFHRDLLSIDNTFGKMTLRLRPADLVACTAPFAFTFGLGMLVVFTLRAGACAFLTETATPAQLADMVAEHQVTVLATAPTAYRQILRDGRAGRLCGLRTAVSAGEHIPRETWQRLRDDVGLRVIDGIGATEMLHIFISAADDDIRPGATGKPVPGYRAAIFDADGNEAGDRPGRLPLPRRRAAVQVRRQRLERHRGHLRERRRRLLLVPGPDRQHDRLLRVQHWRPGGRVGDRHPPGRGGVRRDRQAGPGARLRRLRVRGAPRRRGRRRRQGQGDPGLRQGPAGTVQVPEGRPLHDLTPAQRERQGAALQAARGHRGGG